MKEWTRTDDNQWVYQITDNIFKLMEVRENISDDRFLVVDTIIDITDYDEDDLQSELCPYYDSLEEVKEKYPNPNDQKQIAAECIFEQMWDGLNICYFDSENEAYAYVENFIKDYKE